MTITETNQTSVEVDTQLLGIRSFNSGGRIHTFRTQGEKNLRRAEAKSARFQPISCSSLTEQLKRDVMRRQTTHLPPLFQTRILLLALGSFVLTTISAIAHYYPYFTFMSKSLTSRYATFALLSSAVKKINPKGVFITPKSSPANLL